MCLSRIIVFVILVNGIIYSSGKISTNNNELNIDCKQNETIASQLNNTKHNITTTINSVTVSDCTPHNYAEALAALNVAASKVRKLVLKRFQPPRVLSAAHFDGLQISELEVLADYDSNRASWVFPDKTFIDPIIPTLRTISISGAVLHELPENSIITAKLEFGASSTKWGGCSELEELEIWEWDFPNDRVFANCSKLERASFNWMKVDNVLAGARWLKHLSVMRDLSLSKIDDKVFQDLRELRSLSLTDITITDIDKNAFENLNKIEVIKAKNNRLEIWPQIVDAVSHLPTLQSLILDDNPKLNICAATINSTVLTIKTLSLQKTGLNTLCFGDWRTLTHLDLRQNKIDNLILSHMPTPEKGNVTVDLRGNPVTKVDTDKDYPVIEKKFRQFEPNMLQVLMDPITMTCDCLHGILPRIVKTLPVQLQGIYCSNNTQTELSQDLHECDKYKCGPCTCRELTDGTHANCSSVDLKEMPRFERLRSLLARDNRITKLEVEHFPDYFQFADLTNNRISHVSSTATRQIFSLPGRQLKLADNPLVCVCDTLPFLRAMREHSAQVLDYENITCSNTGERVKLIDLDSLCQATIDLALAASLSTVFVISIILIIVYRKYQYRLKVYLFSRGLFLTWVKEEEIDLDREFDAFISFCHEDDEFVKTNILPALENYKLCIHYRDWIAGEWIPKQIATSIENSRRTILILSKDFVNSLWGMQEFRMAHVAALQEGRRRLIAVIVEDILQDSKLDADLRSYLSMNTYIKWGDPWFFKKLNYALPHYGNKIKGEINRGIDLDEFEKATVRYWPEGTNL